MNESGKKIGTLRDKKREKLRYKKARETARQKARETARQTGRVTARQKVRVTARQRASQNRRRTRISTVIKKEASNTDETMPTVVGKYKETIINRIFSEGLNKPVVVDWENVNEEISGLDEHDKVEKFKEKIGNVKNKIVYGKFWMTGCGHCIDVHPIWEKVVDSLKRNDRYVNVDIRSDNVESGAEALKIITNATVHADGYPTFYKIINGQVYYYKGDRTVASMKNWLSPKSFSI